MMPPASVLTTALQPHQAGHYGGLRYVHCFKYTTLSSMCVACVAVLFESCQTCECAHDGSVP
jgi:hypothetical protein